MNQLQKNASATCYRVQDSSPKSDPFRVGFPLRVRPIPIFETAFDVASSHRAAKQNKQNLNGQITYCKCPLSV